MSYFERIDSWLRTHRDILVDGLRIFIGGALFIRGWLFVAESSLWTEALLVQTQAPSFATATLIHFVALAHLGGGAFLIAGLLTRAAALVQIPILFGAVTIHLPEGLLAQTQSLELSALVLVVLVFLFLHGSGRLSVDHYVFDREQAQPDELTPEAKRILSEPAYARATGGDGGPTEAVPEVGYSDITVKACTCNNTRKITDPEVNVRGRYGMKGALFFLTGITGMPKEIVYQCRTCNRVLGTSSDPKERERYKYRVE